MQKKITQLVNLVKTKLVQATESNHNAPHDSAMNNCYRVIRIETLTIVLSDNIIKL